MKGAPQQPPSPTEASDISGELDQFRPESVLSLLSLTYPPRRFGVRTRAQRFAVQTGSAAGHSRARPRQRRRRPHRGLRAMPAGVLGGHGRFRPRRRRPGTPPPAPRAAVAAAEPGPGDLAAARRAPSDPTVAASSDPAAAPESLGGPALWGLAAGGRRATRHEHQRNGQRCGRAGERRRPPPPPGSGGSRRPPPRRRPSTPVG